MVNLLFIKSVLGVYCSVQCTLYIVHCTTVNDGRCKYWWFIYIRFFVSWNLFGKESRDSNLCLPSLRFCVQYKTIELHIEPMMIHN